MTSIQRVILLINLLYNRQKLSVDEISKELGVDKRTVYRYINKLSEANVPVYYDRNIRGYTLSSRNSAEIGALSDREVVLLLLALKIISHKVNNRDKTLIGSLQRRLDSLQSSSHYEYVNKPSDAFMSNLRNNELSDLVTFLVIQSVIESKNDILVFVEHSDGNYKLNMTKPSLTFDGTWKLSGRRNGEKLEIDLDMISSAQVKLVG
ncbi:MAG: HTH domain-containing protein [candidate division Zixibacteria bacterium]|nr:HTH domain-containing protein [candidate division Zixibacteria bacterium]